MVECSSPMLNDSPQVSFLSPKSSQQLTKGSRLIHGDNLVALKSLADESINTVYIDPPFGTGTVRSGKKGLSYPDFLTCPEAFVAWLSPRLAESRRVLVQTGSLFVHLDYRTVHYVKVALDKLFGRDMFVNEIVWCYSIGGKSQRRFARKHDTILWYSKTKDYAFYSEPIRVARKGGSHMRVRTLEDGSKVQEKTDRKTGKVYQYPVKSGKIPEDWWTDIETLNRSDKERVGWPTQKPQRLLQRILMATTTKRDVVGDWFCGSGTTPKTAQMLERAFIAMDLSKEALTLTASRLSTDGIAPPIETLAAPQQ